MSSFLPSFMKRSSGSEPSETTPLNSEKDAEAAAGEPAAEDDMMQAVQGAAGEAHPMLAQVVQACYAPCVGVAILLLVAFIIFTLATLVMTAHVLTSDCAIWGIWPYTLVVVAILLLDPIVEYSVQCALVIVDTIYSLGGDGPLKRRSNNVTTRLSLYLNLCRTLINSALAIWGLVIWTNLSYKCEAFYLRDENWWLFLEFRCLVVFACFKAAAVAAWTIYVLIKYVSLPPEKSS